MKVIISIKTYLFEIYFYWNFCWYMPFETRLNESFYQSASIFNDFLVKKMHTLWKHLASYSWISSLTGPSGQCCQKAMERPNEHFLTRDLDLWPMTLTYEVHLDILPLDLHAKIQVRTSVRSAVRVVTDTQMDRHTMSKLLHPTHVTDVRCKKQLLPDFCWACSC